MRHRSLVLSLLLLWNCCLLVATSSYTPFVSSVSKYWKLDPQIAGESIPDNSFPLHMKKSIFTHLYYPIYSRESYPKLTSNMIYYGLANSVMADMCSQGREFRKSNQTLFSTCSDFFCTSESQEMPLVQQAQLFMFCWYCMDDETDYTSTENLAFRAEVVSNSRCQTRVNQILATNVTTFLYKECGQENALPFIAPKHVQEIRVLQKRGSDGKVPVTCYCYNWNAYGHVCDFYTIFMIPMAYYGSYWPLLLFGMLATIIFIFFVLIPRCIYSVKLFHKLQDKKCTDILLFFSSTNQSIFWTLMALVAFLSKQILGIFYSFFDVSYFSARGNWYHSVGVVMSFLLGVAYATLLITWSNMVWSPFKASTIRGGLTIPHKIMLVIFYLCYVGSVFLLLTQYIIFKKANYTWGVVSLVILFYIIVFPIGFTIYAFRMCCVLKQFSKNNVFKLKFTQFVILFNIFYLIGSLLIVFYAIDFLAGWDVYGIFLHSTRNIVLDCVFLVLEACLFYLLVDASILDMVYCCGKLAKRKMLKSSITDLNEVSENIERIQNSKAAKYTLLYGQDDDSTLAATTVFETEEDAEMFKNEELQEYEQATTSGETLERLLHHAEEVRE